MPFKLTEVVLEPTRRGLFWNRATRRLRGLKWDLSAARLRWGKAIQPVEAAIIEGIEQLITDGHVGQVWDTLDSAAARQGLRKHNSLYLLRASLRRAGEVKVSGQLVDQPLLDAVLVKLLLEALPQKDRPRGLNKLDPAMKAQAIERIKAEPTRWTVDALVREYPISQGTAAEWKRDAGVQ